MEDLATARISTAQIAQRIIHKSIAEDTEEAHSFELVKEIITAETQDIISDLGGNDEIVSRYEKSAKIALRWIKNYTDYDFRSLGTYTRKDLEQMSLEEDAF